MLGNGQSFSRNGQKAAREDMLKRGPVAVLPFSLQAKHRDSFHSHDYHQIAAARTPGSKIVLGDLTFEIPQNSAVFIPSGVQHALAADSRCKLDCVYFRAAVLHGQVMPISPNRLTDELINELSNTIVDDHTRQLLSACLYDQVSHLLYASNKRTAHLPKPLQQACEIFEVKPETNMHMSEIIQDLGVSERTLRRMAKQYLGCTLSEYRTRHRISKATRLLQAGVPVKNVAFEIGFQSPSSFYQAFQSIVGISPAEFQKKF